MRNRPAPLPTTMDDFVSLCKELRELGAVKVSAHGFEAVFAPPAAPTKAVVAPVPREVKQPDKIEPIDPRAAYREGVMSIAAKAGRHG